MKRRFGIIPLAATFAALVSFGAFAEDAYIEANGNQGINSGYYVTPKSRIEVDFQMTTSASGLDYQMRVFGADGASGYASLYFGDPARNYKLGYGDTFTGVYLAPNDMVRHTVVMDLYRKVGHFVTDGVTNNTVTLDAAMTKTGQHPLGILADTANATATTFYNLSYAKLYGLKIYEEDVLVRNFVPCVMAGEVGLYDTVGGGFYKDDRWPHKAEYELSCGGDILTMDEDGYMESDGSQGVNTRFFTQPNMKIEVDFRYMDASNKTYQQRIFGMDSTNPMVSFYINGSGNFSFGGGDVFVACSLGQKADELRHKAIIDYASGKYVFVTGVTTNHALTINSASRDKTATRPIALFANTGKNHGAFFNSGSKTRIYRARFWDGTGKLVHDYVPRIVDGFKGFRDLVDGEFVAADGGASAPALKAGGRVVSEVGDPYVEGWFGPYFDTGYCFTPKTRIDADFAFLDRTQQQFVFESGGNETSRIVCRMYVSSGYNYSWACQDQTGNWTGTDVLIATNSRRRVSIDAKNRKVSFSTANFTNYTANIADSVPITKTCTATTKIFCDAVSGKSNLAAMRLYGFKIYEDDLLVRDYVPIIVNGAGALYDLCTKTALVSANAKSFTYGGRITDHAYLESDGTQGILTDYYPNPKSKIVVDFQMTEVVGQKRPFGVVNAFSAELYIDGSAVGSGSFAFGLGDSWLKSAVKAADLRRHVATLDAAAKTYRLTTGGNIADLAGTYGNACTKTANSPLGLFCKSDGTGVVTGTLAKMRLYSARIYEDGKLIHEYLPYKEGEVVGLYDTQTGKIFTDAKKSATPFGYGGMGVEGSAGELLVKPASSCKLEYGETTTLKAYAPGAIAYRWTKNGKVIEGATGATFAPAWERMKAPRLNEFTVAPVYLANGVEIIGEPATTTIEYMPLGLIQFVR